MNFTFPFLLSYLSFSRDSGKTAEIETLGEAKPCSSDMCYLLKDFDAMKDKLGVLENRLKDSENQILELKSKESPMVVFSVATGGGNTAIGPFKRDKTLIYRKVITNIGNAYSQSTGIFTAPVTGVYYFTLYHHAGGQHPASLSLMKNSQVIVMTYDHRTSQDTADNGGNAVFLQLQQGDRVYVQLERKTHVWGNDLVTTFSGFLLSQDLDRM